MIEADARSRRREEDEAQDKPKPKSKPAPYIDPALYMPIVETSKIFNIKESSTYTATYLRHIPSYKIGNRRYVEIAAVERLAAERGLD
jgi:hypothetical protein